MLDSVLHYTDAAQNFDPINYQSSVTSYEDDPHALLPPVQEDAPVVNRANNSLLEAILAEGKSTTVSVLLRPVHPTPFQVDFSADPMFLQYATPGATLKSKQRSIGFPKIYESDEPDQSQLFDKKVSWKNEPFTPSDQLLDFIHKGLTEHTKYLSAEAKQKVNFAREAQQKSVGDAVKFGNVLTDLFSRIAFRTLDKVYEETKITDNQKFELVFQHALLDLFPIIPSDFEKFQTLLRRELIDYIEGEGKLEGRWGGIFVHGGELEFALETSPLRGTELEGDWDFAVSDD